MAQQLGTAHGHPEQLPLRTSNAHESTHDAGAAYGLQPPPRSTLTVSE
jgi:hypothetical protein